MGGAVIQVWSGRTRSPLAQVIRPSSRASVNTTTSRSGASRAQLVSTSQGPAQSSSSHSGNRKMPMRTGAIRASADGVPHAIFGGEVVDGLQQRVVEHHVEGSDVVGELPRLAGADDRGGDGRVGEHP